MKKKLLTLLVVVLVLSLLAACGAPAAPTANTPAPQSAPTEPVPATAATAEAADTAVPTPAAKASALSQQEAEAIALEHAGLTADQVSFLHSEYEIDDGVSQYDVEFYHENLEYNYEIHALTGQILEFEKDT